MINIVNGNILNCKENIIVHQVNVQGIMGSGVARQLAIHYPNLEETYSQFCKEHDNDYNELKGSTLFIKSNNKIICNMFSQKENFDTDYKSMKKALIDIKTIAIKNNLSICMPYNIGCRIANGIWKTVYQIIEEVFSDYDVTLYRLEV